MSFCLCVCVCVELVVPCHLIEWINDGNKMIVWPSIVVFLQMENQLLNCIFVENLIGEKNENLMMVWVVSRRLFPDHNIASHREDCSVVRMVALCHHFNWGYLITATNRIYYMLGKCAQPLVNYGCACALFIVHSPWSWPFTSFTLLSNTSPYLRY